MQIARLVGQAYTVNVSAKRCTFASQMISVDLNMIVEQQHSAFESGRGTRPRPPFPNFRGYRC